MNDADSKINIHTVKSVIHYDPVRVDYSISASELDQLKDCSNNNWKDPCLLCAGTSIPCLINAIVIYKKSSAKPFVAEIDFQLNTIVAALGIVLAFAFGRAWFRTKTKTDDIIGAIKNKPKIEL